MELAGATYYARVLAGAGANTRRGSMWFDATIPAATTSRGSIPELPAPLLVGREASATVVICSAILLGDNWSRGGADFAIAESLEAVN